VLEGTLGPPLLHPWPCSDTSFVYVLLSYHQQQDFRMPVCLYRSISTFSPIILSETSVCLCVLV